MGPARKVTFKFYNEISPRYMEPLFLQLEYGRWYDMSELKGLLRSSGLDVEGTDIVGRNTATWALLGLGQTQSDKVGSKRIKLFRLTAPGKQILDTYSTNHELFFDLIHFIFYSAWPRSRSLVMAPFWLYSRVSDTLWTVAPSQVDNYALTNQLQVEGQQSFPDQAPAFTSRSVGAVFLWLQALYPAFLYKCDTRNQLCSKRRSHCTPQLFHLATDLVHTSDGLGYGTSVSVDERHIESISRICLLETGQFWRMAELTKLAIRGYDIRKGQWGTSLVLSGPPNWIELPRSLNEQVVEDTLSEDEDGARE